MKTGIKTTLILMALILFVACKSEQKPQNGQVDSAKTDSATVGKIPAEVENAPDWFEELPIEEGYLYAAATAISRRPALANDKAVMKAQQSLARQVTTLKLSANSESSGGADNISETFEATLKNTKVKKQKQVKEGKYWRVYVLMEIKLDEQE